LIGVLSLIGGIHVGARWQAGAPTEPRRVAAIQVFTVDTNDVSESFRRPEEGLMNARWVLFGFATALMFCARANAAVVVTTNMNGADAEVREEEVNPISTDHDGDGGVVTPAIPIPFGTNRGTNTELASRLKDSTANSGDRTSVMYLKFDISDANGVTNAVLNFADRTPLRLTTRNSAQLRWNRIHHRNPYYGSLPADDTNPEFVAFASDPANYTRVKFNVLGLQNFAHPNYNWSEAGVANTWNPVTSPLFGPEGSLTWYNAPGISPDNRLSPTQDPGKWNFNSDMRFLGMATIEDPGLPLSVPPPFPSVRGAGSAALCVGCVAINFDDTNGELHDLVEEAKLAGQTHITLAVHMSLDAFQNAAGETAQITPNDMLNFNYLFNPKEMDSSTGSPNGQPGLQLNDDPSYNPDWTDVLPAVDPDGPGPLVSGDGVADNGLTGPGPNTQILPHPVTAVPTRYGAQNDDGRFSPQLVFFVPEPSSFVLVAIGALAALGTRRRK
jgi:hypothetical protein